MAKYRPIYIQIWKDPDFQELSPTDKLLFIYLCTNSSTSESGIYPITAKTIADETSLDKETVAKRLHNGLFKNIRYDEENKIVFIKKFRKYNTGGQPALIRKSITQDCFCTPLSPLWAEFIAEYPEYEIDIKTVVKGFNNGCLTEQYPYVNLNNNVKSYKITSPNDIVTKGASKDTPSPFIKNITIVFDKLKTRRGHGSSQNGAEAKAIRDMLKDGFSVENILKAYDLIKARPFFTDKNLSMMQVRKDIHEVLKNGKIGQPTTREERAKALKESVGKPLR